MKLLRMNANENPYGPSPRALEAMRAALDHCHLYPDDRALALRRKLAAIHGLQPEQVMAAAGLSCLLCLIARALLGPGRNAVTGEQSFIMYPVAAAAAGGELIQTPMPNGGFDLGAMASAIDSNTRIIFIANPNNPTGSLVKADQLEGFLRALPAEVTLVLDEAYYEYAQQFARLRQYSRALDYVREGRNLVVLRTFSKAHGLAGIRVGYGMGPAELISRIDRMRTIYSVSAVAQAGALAALDDEAHLRNATERNAEQAQVLLNRMAEMGYTVLETWTNFLYCRLGTDAEIFAGRLADGGVLVQPLAGWGAPQAVRATIGTPEQNQIFLRALARAKKAVTPF
jgi:histidinol-phosphate aminotransferase